MEVVDVDPIGGVVMRWLTRLSYRLRPWLLGLAVFACCFLPPYRPAATAVAEVTMGPQPVQVDSIVFQAGPLLLREDDRGIVILVLATGCGVAACMARRRLWPLITVAWVSWLAMTMVPGIAVVSYYAATRMLGRGRRIGLIVGCAAVVWLPVVAGAFAPEDNTVLPITAMLATTIVVIIVGLPLFIGLWVNARRQVLAGLRERAERLEAEQAARADQARAQERTRIAREMHDVVAHRVSLMVLHAGALEVNTADERTAQAARLIRLTGREALTEIREVLGILRSDRGREGADLTPQPLLADLYRLVAQSRALGSEVTVTVAGKARPLPATVERTAFRVVQEALTNMHKHAGTPRAEVILRHEPDLLQVEVHNGPPVGPAHPLPGSGLGLVGLRERIQLVGGRLEAGRWDGGFTVRARIPVPRREEPA